MKEKRWFGYFEVHLSILIFGATGLFGKWIQLHPVHLVLGRVLFSALFIGLWMILKRESFHLLSKKHFYKMAALGGLLAVHWITFFASIQLSTVAIGLLTFSSFPVFVALIEPLLHKRLPKAAEIGFGVLTVVGILFVLPLEDLSSDMFVGGIVGVISGLTYSVFTIFNAELVKDYSGRQVAFYEHGTAFIWLLPSLFFIDFSPSLLDIGLMMLLGTIFTGFGHSLFINGLKSTGAYMASIITMLEPIYSIILAALFLGEGITTKIIIGGLIILGTVLAASLYERKH
jgi:drug/metabolite transporter (DMT)-like permease